ncbi:hypothetical protein [Jatrophihabitans endophyticus]|uniref:hypothetical protein n=1 Tax=Jatrophihabitans endophyticus TaxID=1206085 RepID=UPI0019EEEB26|nr:hypothetical protein [Jatrophihabitans endophyticus]MBE7187735.1 hypothetical protein [Jatrophihabitans endophyticus]
MSVLVRSAAAVAAVGLLAACTSSGSSGAPSTGAAPSSTAATTSSAAATTSSAAPTTSAPAGGPSTATLKSIVVQQSDLPSGWTGTPAPAESTHDKDVDAQLAACVGSSDAGEQDQIQQVMSDDFHSGQSTVSSDASSYRSESDVRSQVAQLKNPKAQGCLSSLFRKEIAASLPAGSTIKNIAIRLSTADTGIANLIGTANGRITVAAQGRQVTVYIGAGFFIGNRITGQVTFTSIGTPISSAFANPVVKAVAARAANA